MQILTPLRKCEVTAGGTDSAPPCFFGDAAQLSAPCDASSVCALCYLKILVCSRQSTSIKGELQQQLTNLESKQNKRHARTHKRAETEEPPAVQLQTHVKQAGQIGTKGRGET